MGSAPPPPSRLSRVPTARHPSLPAGSSLAKLGTSRDPAEPTPPVPQDLGASQLPGRRPPEGPPAPSSHPERDPSGMERPGRKSYCKPRRSPVQTHPPVHRRREGRDVLGSLGQRSGAWAGHQAFPQTQISAATARTHLIYCPPLWPRGGRHVPSEPHQGRHRGTVPGAGLPSRGCCWFPFLTLLEKIKK